MERLIINHEPLTVNHYPLPNRGEYNWKSNSYNETQASAPHCLWHHKPVLLILAFQVVGQTVYNGTHVHAGIVPDN